MPFDFKDYKLKAWRVLILFGGGKKGRSKNFGERGEGG